MAATFNVGSVAIVGSEVFFQIDRIPRASFPLASIAIHAVHYFLFMRNRRFLDIAQAIESDPIQRNRPTGSGWLYVLGSLVLFLALVAVLATRNAA
jgi:hypothetical protein